MLKQSALFDKLKKKKLTVQQYYMLYYVHNLKKALEPINIERLQKSVPAEYITENGKLSEKGMKLLKEIDTLFKPIKSLSDLERLGEGFNEKIEAYMELFPTGKLPNGQYARGNKKSIQGNFVWFFQEYDYDWDTILKATTLYVNEYRPKNFLHMRTAMYFIKKLVQGSINCDLATYCEAVINGEYEQQEEDEDNFVIGRIV